MWIPEWVNGNVSACLFPITCVTSQNKAGLFLLNWLYLLLSSFFSVSKKKLMVVFLFTLFKYVCDSCFRFSVSGVGRKEKQARNKQTNKQTEKTGRERKHPSLPRPPLFSRACFSFHSAQLTEKPGTCYSVDNILS